MVVSNLVIHNIFSLWTSYSDFDMYTRPTRWSKVYLLLVKHSFLQAEELSHDFVGENTCKIFIFSHATGHHIGQPQKNEQVPNKLTIISIKEMKNAYVAAQFQWQ